MSQVRTLGALGGSGSRLRGPLAGAPDAVAAAVLARCAQAARFAQMGLLAGGIVHEIANPISCVRSGVSVLQRDLPRLMELVSDAAAEPGGGRAQGEAQKMLAECREILHDVSDGAEVLAQIAQGLRSLVCSAREAPQPTALHECIEAALRVAKHKLGHGIDVTKELGPVPVLPGYPGLLIELFVNLFVNAAEAMEGAGRLTIRTSVEQGLAVVEIEDTGKGIAPEDLRKVFRPFFTTRSGADALGLGLAMCQRIARKHRGEIGISSTPGRGTTVRIELPAGAESERGRCSAPPVSGARRRGAAGGAVRHAGGWS